MKIKVTNKTRIKILLMIISLLMPVLNISAISLGEAGELANFEMRIDNIGANILGTVIYKAGYTGNIYNNKAMDNAINEPIDIFFSNVKYYLSDGTTADLFGYYWTAESRDEHIAIVEIGDSEYDDDIGTESCYLILTPKSLGTAVISVSMSTSLKADTLELVNPVTKTFSINIVDAAKHAEAEPTFLRSGGASISAGVPLQIGYTTATTISIDKLVGYDYSNLSGGSYYKNITNYKWHASLSRTDIIKINDASSISSQSINSGKAEKGSTKNIVITPLKEGVVDIVFTFTPTDSALISVYGDDIKYIMTVDVTKVVGAFDFTITSDRKAYGGNEPANSNTDDEWDNIFGFGMSLQRDLAFSANNNNAYDLNSDIDIMFQKPTEPVIKPTEPYDLNSAVDIMYQNKNTTPTEKSPNLVPTVPTTKNNQNNNTGNFEVDLNSSIDIMFQKPTEPTIEPTEPYDLNSAVDIMFQNDRAPKSNSPIPTIPTTAAPTTKSSNFEVDLNSPVDIMYQKPTQPVRETTEPYDLNSAVDIMFQNKNGSGNNNSNNIYGDPVNSSNTSAAGLSGSYGAQNIQDFAAAGISTGGDKEVTLTISEFKAQINGVWQDITDNIPFEITEISYKYPTRVINPSANSKAMTEVVINEKTNKYELEYLIASMKNDNEIKITIDNIELQESFDVTVSIKANIYGDTKTSTKSYKVMFVKTEQNGSISNVSMVLDRETEINDKQVITGLIGRNQSEIMMSVEIGSIDIIDFTAEDNIRTLYNLNEYEFSVKSSAPNVVGVIMPDLDTYYYEDDSTFKLLLKKTGKSTVTVTVTDMNNRDITHTRTFTVNVTDGVLSSEEGAIASAVLKYREETLYRDKTELYAFPDTKMQIDIVRLMEFSSLAKSSDNYMRELKNYSWEAISNSYTVSIESGTERGSSSDSGKKTITLNANNIGTATIMITFVSDREDIQHFSPYTFTFTVIVNEIGGRFMPLINYDKETVTIMAENGSGIYLYEFDPEKGPEYMYCLKAVADGASQDNEKWYPFMGSEMDISSFVPKSGAPYRLGIRLAYDVEKEANGNYSSANRQVVLISPRRVLSKAEKNEIVYKNEQIMLNSPGADEIDIYYQVGLSGWLKGTISGSSGIPFPSSLAPMGAVVQIKYAAVTGEKESSSNFGSAPVKVKVPKASAKPNIKQNNKKSAYTGFSNKMEYSVDGETWAECPKGSIAYSDLKSKFKDLYKEEDSSDYVLFLRTKANYKRDGILKTPASDIVLLKIAESIYE